MLCQHDGNGKVPPMASGEEGFLRVFHRHGDLPQEVGYHRLVAAGAGQLEGALAHPREILRIRLEV